MKTNFRNCQNGFSRIPLILICLVVMGGATVLVLCFRDGLRRIESTEAMAGQMGPTLGLPSAIVNAIVGSKIVAVEHHLGCEWIIARGVTNWARIVYYPNVITIQSVRRVQLDHFGNIISVHVANMPSSDVVHSVEITASLNNCSQYSTRVEDFAKSVTESFVLQPTVVGAETLFVAVDPLLFRDFSSNQLQAPLGGR